MKLLNDFTPAEQELLRNVVLPGVKDGFIDFFLRTCHAKQVDPFSGHLYMQIRETKIGSGVFKASIQCTVDGARAQASKSGDYAGSDEPEFDVDDGVPKWCKVTVWKKVGKERYAFTAKCRYSEFKPKAPNDFQWQSGAKPFHMLAKVTEVQALRKGWPEALAEVNVGGDAPDEAVAPVQAVESVEAALSQVVDTRWINALKAFETHGINGSAMLTKLGKPAPIGLTPDDYTTLEAWYGELQRGEQTA